MKLAIMQPYFFPYLGYFQLIQAADKFVLYSACQYTSGSWITRNRIALRNTSSTLWLTVPVKNCPVQTPICEVEIQYNQNHWQRDLLKHIRFNYQKSPFYPEIFPVLEEIIAGNSFRTIAELNNHSVITLSEKLGIDTCIQTDNEVYADIEKHLQEEDAHRAFGRGECAVESLLRREKRIVEICRLEQCRHYLNAPGGIDLYDKNDFERQGVNLSFVQMDEIVYPPVSSSFIPHLSIIDVLMQNGWAGTSAMLNRYTLK